MTEDTYVHRDDGRGKGNYFPLLTKLALAGEAQ